MLRVGMLVSGRDLLALEGGELKDPDHCFWGFIRVIYGYMGIMQKKIDATMMCYIGVRVQAGQNTYVVSFVCADVYGQIPASPILRLLHFPNL